MTELRILHKHMQEVLAGAQAKRKGVSDDSWVHHERAAMLQAVNIERGRRWLLPITMETLVRHEQSAVGHIDYSIKFALYWAELALGVPSRR